MTHHHKSYRHSCKTNTYENITSIIIFYLIFCKYAKNIQHTTYVTVSDFDLEWSFNMVIEVKTRTHQEMR